MNGMINFLKPAGMTSHDAISFFRRTTGIKKIGHSGTLDPMACGVLPICIGRSTRLIEYMKSDKTYRAVMRLGFDSETQDVWGKDLQQVTIDKIPDFSEIVTCLKGFEGLIEQQIPGFSAQKHEGKKLYQYAREGKEIPIKTKQVYINDITVIRSDESKKEVMFDVDCSKGTYVRTICSDAGKKLGTNAVMSFLLRTSVGGINVGDSVTEEEITEEMNLRGNLDRFMIKPERYLDLKQIELNHKDSKRFQNGLITFMGKESNYNNNEEYAVIDAESEGQNQLIGIGIIKDKSLKPKKVFHTE